MRKAILIVIALLMAASFVAAQVTDYRKLDPIYVTSAASDTTITADWDAVGIQVYFYDAAQWVTLDTGDTRTFKVPAASSFTVPTDFVEFTIHRDGTTAGLVSVVHK